MLPFDQNFYLLRKKIWLIIKENFDEILYDVFESIKINLQAEEKQFFSQNKNINNDYKVFLESVFIQPLTHDAESSEKAIINVYTKNNLPIFLFIDHLNIMQKSIKYFLRNKFWYNPLLSLKYLAIIDDLFFFVIKNTLIHHSHNQTNCEEKINTADFTTVLNQNLAESIQKMIRNSQDLKDYSFNINKVIVSIAQQTHTISQESEEIYGKFSNVSITAEELSKTITKTAKEISNTALVSQTSKDQAKNTENIVNDLKKTVSRIDEVVLLISEIANQTNLLALNATIESARSGNAGKGFAVVASEVKKLATQTSLATEEIKQKILEVQNHTDQVVDAIHDMNSTIDDINETTSIISKSIEEQSLATQKIYTIILEVGKAFQKIAKDIDSVDIIANNTQENILKVSNITHSIESNSSRIKKTIENLTEITNNGRDERI